MPQKHDIDKILRLMAARDQVTERDSASGWERVRRLAGEAQCARRRSRQRTLVLATSLGVLLIGVAIWQEVGTEDFVLVPAPPGPRGEIVFTGRHRPYSFAVTSDTLGSQSIRQLGEELLSRTEGGEGQLTRVIGATIRGKTHFIAIGTVQTSLGPQKTTLNLPIPLGDEPTDASMTTLGRFFAAHLDATRHAIESGEAHALAPIEVAVGGQAIRCERWQFLYPEFGPVVYWEGKP